MRKISAHWESFLKGVSRFSLVVILTICIRIVLPAQSLELNADPVSPYSKATPPLNIDSTTDYLVYYGTWDSEKLFRAQDFRLVILEPSNVTPSIVADLRKGHDGMTGTSDDVIVIGYLSAGEDNVATNTGNGRGPCYWSWDSSKIIYEKKGLASWYVDDSDINGAPDRNNNWNSYYVNAGDTLWWQHLKSFPSGADHTLTVLRCDGLFLDTIDSASPFSTWPYRWTVVGMSQLVGWLRQQYPTKILIGNRGLFYFDPQYITAYANTIRPYVDGIMFESYYRDGSRAQRAAKINAEATKPDGFKVLALDYFAQTDTVNSKNQMREVYSYNWSDYISSSSLNEIRYDVFHRHGADKNPPTWNSSIGLNSAIAADRSALLTWSGVTDQSLPVSFNVYYSTQTPFVLSNATTLAGVAAVRNSQNNSYQYSVSGLTNYIKYSLVVRAIDAQGNEDKNLTVCSATPPYGSTTLISIDGKFSDWQTVAQLDVSPNPVESGGDVTSGDADIVDVWSYNDSKNLYLSYSVAGNLSADFFYHVFLDTDRNTLTGFRFADSAAVGAEFMIENGTFWRYIGTGGSNWGWSPASGLAEANADGRRELSILLSVLGINAADGGEIHLMLNDNTFAAPYATVDLVPDLYKEQYLSCHLSPTMPTSVAPRNLPYSMKLEQNYPNPFNPSTTISFHIPSAGPVSLKVFDLLGKEVATLAEGQRQQGSYSLLWNATQYSSGIYFCRLEAGGQVEISKIVLIK